MKTAIIGMGVQGRKRQYVCGENFAVWIDPHNKGQIFQEPYNRYDYIQDAPLDEYEAAIVCTPWQITFDTTKYLIENKKHVMAEKPLWCVGQSALKDLIYLAAKNEVVLYTAYNHRFEPSIQNAKDLLDNRKIGRVYFCRIFYGYGSVTHVQESSWQDDKNSIGIFGGMVPHLLDTLQFLFGGYSWFQNVELVAENKFENKTPDHVIFKTNNGSAFIECEGTYFAWKNHFAVDIFGEKGSIHINDLVKWGECQLEWRKRVYPSGVPKISKATWCGDDESWQKEWDYFKHLIETEQYVHTQQDNDLHYNYAINKLWQQSRSQ